MMGSTDGAPARAIVFDCDGVLLDSNRLKTECFGEVLTAAGFDAADIAKFLTFQRENFGLSRYRLFERLLEWPLAVRPPVTQADLLALYSEAVSGRYALCDTTEGMWPVVTALAETLPLYIVSGSDQAELRRVLAAREQAAPFRIVFGSPATKDENLRTVMADLASKLDGIRPEEVIFVGDAEADWRAAHGAGLRFIYMDRYSTVQTRMRALASEHGFARIDTLPELPALVAAARSDGAAPP
ncbi:HAD family hydrolase [Roseococcus sp.]|uniref:HAD family hydrolase n=1 Tax=Roseococcus sp. TaxID=2109646 RepID=UPI003BAB3B82